MGAFRAADAVRDRDDLTPYCIQGLTACPLAKSAQRHSEHANYLGLPSVVARSASLLSVIPSPSEVLLHPAISLPFSAISNVK